MNSKNNDLNQLSFPGQVASHKGKVRDNFIVDDKFISVLSDRVSTFDVILDRPIPGKGIILSSIATLFLQQTKDIVPNWLLAQPHPRVMVGKKCTPILVEMVIRGYLTGHAYREYKAGKRTLCGEPMPGGMKENDEFPQPIITPTTKAKKDEDITPEEIFALGLATKEQFEIMCDYTRKLFEFGTRYAAQHNLILVDTKYEFGTDENGNIILMDEVNTPDSSRYFYLDTYEELQKAGKAQRHLSKEFLRELFINRGFDPEKPDTTLLVLSEEDAISTSERYQELYKTMTGEDFPKEWLKPIDEEEIKDILRKSMSVVRASRRIQVAIVMGSDSDLVVMEKAAQLLDELCIGFEMEVVSAHRTPHRIPEVAYSFANRDGKVIIAAAGGAAHLPGMMAAYTTLPVIGVPIKSSNSMIGLDSLLSIGQMPPGVPVMTMAIDGSQNAAIAAAQILALSDEGIKDRLDKYKTNLKKKVETGNQKLSELGY